MIQILYILIITSVVCSLLGVFLIFRNMAMLCDAISHCVLLGIVLAFFTVKDLSGIYLIISASISGVISCICIELLSKARKISKDSAVGIIFTLFFSIAVILISKYAKNYHLDVDMVLMGELILAPFNKIKIMGTTLPKSLAVMSTVGILNILYLALNFKKLCLASFDEIYAKTAGIRMSLLYYSFMTMVSLTAVAAFDTVGAILTISFFIAPSASAYLITKRIKRTVVIAVIYAIINSVAAYKLASAFNVSMSGMCAAVAGVSFLLTFLFNKEGLITKIFSMYRKKIRFRNELIIFHIGNHARGESSTLENGVLSIGSHLAWSELKLRHYINNLIRKGYVYKDGIKGVYLLTEKGLEFEKTLKREYGI